MPTDEVYAASLHRCLDAVARERRHLAFTAAPPPAAMLGFVQALVASGEIQLLAVDGHMVVGWCDIMRKQIEGFTHVGTLGMGVLASHRRRGLGKQLVLGALDRARAAGIERVELEAFASNHPAIVLYEKVGFAHEGVKHRARKLDDQYDDIVLMAIDLNHQ
jgi:ribosomal protein S18 acetylase RimI-like enzyme